MRWVAGNRHLHGRFGIGYGGATDLLGLKYDDPVRIEFAAAQAAPTLEL